MLKKIELLCDVKYYLISLNCNYANLFKRNRFEITFYESHLSKKTLINCSIFCNENENALFKNDSYRKIR